MLIVVGFVIVLLAVFGGFVLQDGHLAALFQPYELLMIFGGALGAFVIANDRKAIGLTWHSVPMLFHGSRYTRELYMALMALMFDLLTKVRREGLMALENDIDAPYESAVFTKYRIILLDDHLMDFITDYLRLMVSGTMNSYQLENLMDNEISTYQEDADILASALKRKGYTVAVRHEPTDKLLHIQLGPVVACLNRKAPLASLPGPTVARNRL